MKPQLLDRLNGDGGLWLLALIASALGGLVVGMFSLGAAAIFAFVGAAALAFLVCFRFSWVFLAFLVALPLQNFEVVDELPGMVWTPTRFLVPLLVFSWAIWRLSPSTPPAPRLRPGRTFQLLAPAALFVGVLLMSVFVSRDPELSFQALPRLAEHLAVFVIVVDVVRRPGWLRTTLFVLAFSSGVSALVAVAQEGISGGRLAGLWDQPNTAANYLAVFLPCLLFAAHAHRKRILSVAAAALAASAVLAVLATFSRGGLLALVAAAVAFYFHRLSRLAIFGLVVMVALFLTPLPERLIENFDSREKSVDRRLELTEIGLESSLEALWTGYGFNTFRQLHEHTKVEFPSDLFWKGDLAQNLTSHNLYLLLLVETGLPALVFFAWFWLAAYWRLWGELWSRPPRLGGGYGQVRALVAVGAALLVSRLTITQFLSFAFWVPWGLVLGGLLLWQSRDASPAELARGSDG